MEVNFLTTNISRITMYRGSGKYFIGILRSRALWLYGAGSGVNTAIQVILINIGLLNRGPLSSEGIAYIFEKYILIAFPILPPYSAADIVSVLFNLLVAVLLAGLWTAKWSEGMANYHGR